MTNDGVERKYLFTVDISLLAHDDECGWSVADFEHNILQAMQESNEGGLGCIEEVFRVKRIDLDPGWLSLHAFVMISEQQPLDILDDFERYAEALGKNLHAKCQDPAVDITTRVQLNGPDYRFIDTSRVRENVIRRRKSP